jgi:lysozyme family protein
MAASSWPATISLVEEPDNDGQGPHTTPGDSGLLTNRGVTAAAWADAVESGIVKGSLIDASMADLELVLRVKFANAIQFDQLPAGVDMATFNISMASGPGVGARLLQEACGVRQDGHIGPITLAAVARMDPAKLINVLTADELAFDARLSSAPLFLRGWTRRANDVRTAALLLASGYPALTVDPDNSADELNGQVLAAHAAG